MKANNFYSIIVFLFVVQLNAQNLNTEITENTKNITRTFGANNVTKVTKITQIEMIILKY